MDTGTKEHIFARLQGIEGLGEEPPPSLLAVYKATASFPRDELYGLTSQIRRACVSIPANIAEGCGRDGEVELARFLQIAMGSAAELEYHLLLTSDLKLLGQRDYQKLVGEVTEVKRMLTSFIQTLKADR